MSDHFSLNQEQLELQNQASEAFRFLHEKRDAIRNQMLHKKEMADVLWQAFAESGFMGALIPQELGGTNKGLLALVFAFEKASSIGYINALAMLTQMNAICMIRHGNDEMKQKFLPAIAQGKIKCCVAATEEGSGTNMFRIKTLATKTADGYVINGSKIYISGAGSADKMFILCRTKSGDQCREEGLPKTFGLSIFWVDANAKGINKTMMPTRGETGLKQYLVKFEDLHVGHDQLIGPADAGSMVMFDAINLERILGSAMMLGVSQHCLNVATKYAKERSVFGKNPIGIYQALQHPLADVKIRQEAVRLTTYKAATLFDAQADPFEVGQFANISKYLGSEIGLKAVDAAIETLGGKGFNEDYDLIHLWEDVRLFKSAPASNNMILNFVAEHDLGLPRSY